MVAEVPAELPANIPADTRADIPADIPAGIPADIPGDSEAGLRTEDLELSVHVTSSVSLEGDVITTASSGAVNDWYNCSLKNK
ncbi:hypothetical protein BsWGS_00758 [Bradybaena similaris]